MELRCEGHPTCEFGRPKSFGRSEGQKLLSATNRLFEHPTVSLLRLIDLALGPVSRILCDADKSARSRHFSQVCLATDLSATARLRGRGGMRHTRDYWAGHPVTYFALHRKGFFVPPTLPLARWALTPPFHPHQRETSPRWQFVFCDTVRRHALTRAARACGEACAASCPAVSGLSSPNFYRARVSPHLGIKELGATTKPQS